MVFLMTFPPPLLYRALQEEKVYVQHRISENSKLLWELIAKQKACFYIAG